ncbi:MAG: hypothetical protein K6D61_08310 [Prevotella sp.]|nr:hypothetical protein [Prevotella sp.]
MGAKAANWVEVYTIDYSQLSEFPFYVMGYAPTCNGTAMVDAPTTQKLWRGNEQDFPGEAECTGTVTVNGTTFYVQELGENQWRQYFIADGIPTQIDGSYKVVAMVKASEACDINVNMGWGWGGGEQASCSVSIGTTWTEVEWEYSGIAGASCNLVAQPGTAAATIEWKYVKVYENQKPQAPTIWQEWLTSDGQPVIVESTVDAIPNWMGNADTPWSNPNVAFNDQTQNYLICAWSKVNAGDPFPSPMESVDGSNVFVVHATDCADPTAEASAWDNQFWIQSPREWQAGEQLKIHFRYKCSKPSVTTNTQIHKQNPSDYLIWHAIGDITFTDQWQTFDGTMTMDDSMAGGWSIAFNLNPNEKTATDFYFDDLSWQSMKLDEGYFIAGCNTKTGLDYDLANAVQFEGSGDEITAVVGADEWVNQVMISTVRGNDAAFKSHTLKPAGIPEGGIESDPENWMDYEPASVAKLDLALAGKWEVTIDTAFSSMAFEMLEGEEAGISKVVFDFTNGTRTFYNLAGQPVSEDYKGVVIQNGKKVVKK